MRRRPRSEITGWMGGSLGVDDRGDNGQGTRVMMWKQDPSVGEIGMRKAFIPSRVLEGPRDDKIVIRGLAPVRPDNSGDFLDMRDSEGFDAVHTYAIVRQALTMYERALSAGGQQVVKLQWAWNSRRNNNPIQVYPYGLPDEQNAFYLRQGQCLRFGHFMPESNPAQRGRVFTCRSLDVVSHETGHAILDGIKPNWLVDSAPPQTGALHEAFGDLTAIFLTLSQLDQVEAIIAQTKANLRDRSFLVDLAEEFGRHGFMQRADGLRNAVNNLTVSSAGFEVHNLSLVFTGAVYDVLSEIFALKRRPELKDDAVTLLEVGSHLRSLFIRAIVSAPDWDATFTDVFRLMMNISQNDMDPQEYRDIMQKVHDSREMWKRMELPRGIRSRMAFNEGHQPGIGLEIQDRHNCCSTMQCHKPPEHPPTIPSSVPTTRRRLPQQPTDNSGYATWSNRAVLHDLSLSRSGRSVRGRRELVTRPPRQRSLKTASMIEDPKRHNSETKGASHMSGGFEKTATITLRPRSHHGVVMNGSTLRETVI